MAESFQRAAVNLALLATPLAVPAIEIPIRRDGPLILMEVSVNDAAPATFALDSSATHSVLDTKYAHELGLKIEHSLPITGTGKGQTMLLAALGLTMVIAISIGLTRLMTSMLYHVSATDPVVFLSVTGLLAFIALLAAFLPARRATRVSPIMSLRAE